MRPDGVPPGGVTRALKTNRKFDITRLVKPAACQNGQAVSYLVLYAASASSRARKSQDDDTNLKEFSANRLHSGVYTRRCETIRDQLSVATTLCEPQCSVLPKGEFLNEKLEERVSRTKA